MGKDAMVCCLVTERYPEYKGSADQQVEQVGRSGWVAWVLKTEKDLVKCIKKKKKGSSLREWD